MKPSHILAVVVPFSWIAWWSISGAVKSAQKLQADHIVGVTKKVAVSEPKRSFALLSSAKAPKRRYTFSTYADKYVGRKMSNGKRYSHDAATVASNDYPLGTRLRLTTEWGFADAVVTDRMAKRFSGLRIDLSRSLWDALSGGAKPGLLKGWASEVQR